ncbi:tyrosine-type recombinase/integrase [Flavobacterium chungbukense]|uniref:Site-specific recombinase XerD n=1 Tax=Flavobacterium chungbukense TaxID=877464 RepID=A0ABP7YCF1_9FLAO|nr:site-specific integrase [Flavobacterium chungbukense]MCC4923495.1 site-specific integrase [Flavobacterium chungbukense]
MSNYTTPKLNKGKAPLSIPRGSSKLKELAKNVWYVSYTFEGKQYKVKDNLNRIHDPAEKELAGEILLESIKQDLKNGYNPLKPLQWTEHLRKETTTLESAIKQFEEYHKIHNSRKKTIQTYLSKMNALSKYLPSVLLSEVKTKNLESFVRSKISDNTYSQDSVKSVKRVFSTFFNVCIKLDLIQINPMNGFDGKIKSNKVTEERHVPFSDTDLKTILDYLDANDKYSAFFCRMIYYTCLRPSEIRGLKVENINMESNRITIPASVKKVTSNNENDYLDINSSFAPILKELNLEQYPKDYYLTGSSTNIVGEKIIGENTPYNKLISALKKLGLNEKGYDLYSFKHTSNIKKYIDGWTLSQIMKANRHTNISTTEIYLKKLGQFVDIRNKAIPVI